MVPLVSLPVLKAEASAQTGWPELDVAEKMRGEHSRTGGPLMGYRMMMFEGERSPLPPGLC